MDIMGLLTGKKNYIDLVKEFIYKVFAHEARRYHCKPADLKIIIDLDESGTMSIMTYSNPDNKVWRVIPDKEVQEILMK
jgi:hypothetical protein